MKFHRALALPALLLLVVSSGASRAREASAKPATWHAQMRKVHARFKGKPGTFAHFGDSITYSMAFWAPLQWKAKKAPPGFEGRRKRVAAYLHADCWRNWKGARHGNYSGKTVKWAATNIDTWLKEMNPEVALIMFGTNDLKNVKLADYESGLRGLVARCLANGSVVILSTIPPRSGYEKKSAKFAAAARKIALELKVPLSDFHSEVLKRRPRDWDGSARAFEGHKTYDVPTLIARDGIHPSNPAKWRRDYTADGLKHNGFELRNYLTLNAYDLILQRVLSAAPRQPSEKAPKAVPAASAQPSASWWPKAPALPAPTGEVIKVASVRELFAAARDVKPGGTIMIAKGRYRLSRRLEIKTDRVTLRGATGRREDVVLDGGGIGELVAFTKCSGVTVADLTIENVRWNGFKINSETGVQKLTIRNCTIHNVWQRGVKGVRVPLENRDKLRPTDCRVEYCLFYNDRAKKFSDDPDDKPGKRFDGNYIGGIDVMYAKGWTIADNVFLRIQGRTREGRGAVFLWHEIEDCVVERNVFIDCDAGVCLGNSYLPKVRGIKLHARRCIVRNNFVTRAPEKGILAAYTLDCKLINNTVHDPANRLRRLIRLVGSNQGLVVANNLLSGPKMRVETKSKVKFANNVQKPLTGIFRDPEAGDLHLKKNHAEVVDKADRRDDVARDFDGSRRGEKPDVGADELGSITSAKARKAVGAIRRTR
jgi:lysophospholipase L1-like esterase